MLFSATTILSLSSIVVASPLSTRNPASSALHALSKRNPWNLDPALSSELQAAFTTGLKDAISIAAAVLDPTNGIDNRDKNNQYMIAYFGQDDETTYDQVRSVFQNLVGTNSDGTGSNIPATVTVYDEDWVIPGPGKGPGGGGDGTKPLCDFTSSSGLTLTAYTATRREKGTKWGMHFCPKWTARVTAGYSLSRITANSCAALQDTSVMDTTLMNRQNYAFGILHEFFHVRELAWDVTGKTTGDFAYGAWNVLELALGRITRPNGGVAEPLENADTFAWYALHLYLNANCGGKTFDKATSVDNGIGPDGDPTGYPAEYTSDDEDLQYGPSQFCEGLSPGGGGTCIDIPDGCYIIKPLDNTVPTPVCGDQ